MALRKLEHATPSPADSSVKVLGKTFQILEALAVEARPVTIVELARLVRQHRTSVHRTVRSLVQHGYVEQTDSNPARFQVGINVLPLAARYLNHNPLRSIALTHLYSLTVSTGFRGHLGSRAGNNVMYLGGFEKPPAPAIYSWFGQTAPLHCCSLGKALLAHMPEGEMRALLTAAPLEQITEHTITDPNELIDQLQQVRATGIAYDEREHTERYCIAVPIFGAGDRAIAAISLSSMDRDQLMESRDALLATGSIVTQAAMLVRVH